MAAYRRVYDSRHRQADCQRTRISSRTLLWVIEYGYLYLFIPGGPKNVLNFRMALRNTVYEMNQQKSMYVMSKHLRICQ